MVRPSVYATMPTAAMAAKAKRRSGCGGCRRGVDLGLGVRRDQRDRRAALGLLAGEEPVPTAR